MKKPFTSAAPKELRALGDHIRKRRVELRIFQREAAAILGISEDSLTYWENGRAKPQIRHYPRIIAFLGYYPFDHRTDSIAEKITYVRYRTGWSFQQFGRRLGVNGTTVQVWHKSSSIKSKLHENSISKLFFELHNINYNASF